MGDRRGVGHDARGDLVEQAGDADAGLRKRRRQHRRQGGAIDRGEYPGGRNRLFIGAQKIAEQGAGLGQFNVAEVQGTGHG